MLAKPKTYDEININEEFDVLPHFYFKDGVAKEQSITKDLLPFVIFM